MTRYWMAAAIVAMVATPAMAQEAHSGTWVSNEAKSYWSDGKFPAGFKLTIEMKFTPNRLVYHAVNTTRPGTPYINDFIATLDDTVSPMNNPRFNEIRIRTLDDNTLQVLEQKDGDVIVGQYWRFAEDGRSLVRWGIGKAPDGRSKAFLEWFDRVR